MYSERFLQIIKILQEDYGLERSVDNKLCLDKDNNPLPWYTYPAIEYLSQFDYSNKKVFEFGCGYSSLFWANQAQKVISVEDNATWFDKWSKEFILPNLDILLREEGLGYEEAIFESKEKFDIIVIDGKRRSQCAKVAIEALADDGMIILDDSDRINTSVEYEKAVACLKAANLLQVDFYGFCPMDNYTKTTSLFLSRSFDFVSKHNIQPINGIGNLWSKSRKTRKEFYKKNS